MQFDFQLEDSKILNKEPWKKKKKKEYGLNK